MSDNGNFHICYLSYTFTMIWCLFHFPIACFKFPQSNFPPTFIYYTEKLNAEFPQYVWRCPFFLLNCLNHRQIICIFICRFQVCFSCIHFSPPPISWIGFKTSSFKHKNHEISKFSRWYHYWGLKKERKKERGLFYK